MGLSLGAEPQGGCGLQPRVAASATLGNEFSKSQPQGGCARFDPLRKWRNRVAVE